MPAGAIHAVADAAVQRAPRRGSHAGAPYSPLIPTVFHTDWWLDIAYRGRHQEITVDNGMGSARFDAGFGARCRPG